MIYLSDLLVNVTRAFTAQNTMLQESGVAQRILNHCVTLIGDKHFFLKQLFSEVLFTIFLMNPLSDIADPAEQNMFRVVGDAYRLIHGSVFAYLLRNMTKLFYLFSFSFCREYLRQLKLFGAMLFVRLQSSQSRSDIHFPFVLIGCILKSIRKSVDAY